MLPASLSEGEGSLLPGEERPGVTAYFTRDGTECVGWERTRIIVRHSFDYESFAPALLDLPAEPACTDSHAWIADWMIRYNTAAAKELCRIGMGLLRVQSAADAAAVGTWRNIHPDLAWMANEAASYEALTSKDAPNKGHAGMGGIAYTHASSPLRRYADLVNQRILTAAILGGDRSVITESLVPLAAHLNERCKAERRWSRDLTFLEHVRPGRVETIRIVWVDEGRIWIPEWRRIIRIRHTPSCQKAQGSEDRIQIFCDPTKRSWKRRVLTAELPQTR
jgi:exoribonuclease R